MLRSSSFLATRLPWLALILAPLLLAVSTFFWTNGEYGVGGGMLLSLSTVFWIIAFAQLFELLRPAMPLYSVIGFAIAVYGCVGGENFAIAGVFSQAFVIPHSHFLRAAAEHPAGFNLLLFWPGPLFPLSLLVLGIQLTRKKLIPRWAGVFICLGAAAFPLSRIPRIEWVAHTTDLLLVIPFFSIGWRRSVRPAKAGFTL